MPPDNGDFRWFLQILFRSHFVNVWSAFRVTNIQHIFGQNFIDTHTFIFCDDYVLLLILTNIFGVVKGNSTYKYIWFYAFIIVISSNENVMPKVITHRGRCFLLCEFCIHVIIVYAFKITHILTKLWVFCYVYDLVCTLLQYFEGTCSFLCNKELHLCFYFYFVVFTIQFHHSM